MQKAWKTPRFQMKFLLEAKEIHPKLVPETNENAILFLKYVEISFRTFQRKLTFPSKIRTVFVQRLSQCE